MRVFTQQVRLTKGQVGTGDFDAHLELTGELQIYTHTNKNGVMIRNFLKESKCLCLNTIFQNSSRQLWTHSARNRESEKLCHPLTKQMQNITTLCKHAKKPP